MDKLRFQISFSLNDYQIESLISPLAEAQEKCGKQIIDLVADYGMDDPDLFLHAEVYNAYTAILEILGQKYSEALELYRKNHNIKPYQKAEQSTEEFI